MLGTKILRQTTLIGCMTISASSLATQLGSDTCLKTATATWAEKQVYLLFETASQELQRIACQKNIEHMRSQSQLDAKYANTQFNDNEFRKESQSLANPAVSYSAQPGSSAKFQTMTDKNSQDNQNNIPTVRGFKTISDIDS